MVNMSRNDYEKNDYFTCYWCARILITSKFQVCDQCLIYYKSSKFGLSSDLNFWPSVRCSDSSKPNFWTPLGVVGTQWGRLSSQLPANKQRLYYYVSWIWFLFMIWFALDLADLAKILLTKLMYIQIVISFQLGWYN